jgi:hypothetical protein
MDSFFGLNIMIISVQFYTIEEDGNKIYLMDKIKNNKYFQNKDFYESSLIESIYDVMQDD